MREVKTETHTHTDIVIGITDLPVFKFGVLCVFAFLYCTVLIVLLCAILNKCDNFDMFCVFNTAR